mmetsp:Transcript_50222/g.141199  ORF Transcript_50222/g.141199 Transcript_50222/m.141199 type:complete len:85 (+) Transcript_50222:38-292(+)
MGMRTTRLPLRHATRDVIAWAAKWCGNAWGADEAQAKGGRPHSASIWRTEDERGLSDEVRRTLKRPAMDLRRPGKLLDGDCNIV